jgi:hypothetical protein
VNTLTRTAEIAIGSVTTSEIRASRPATPAADAVAITTARITSGPRYPPTSSAPSDPVVAATALVSGLRRWYGDGADGARLARNATSSAGS